MFHDVSICFELVSICFDSVFDQRCVWVKRTRLARFDSAGLRGVGQRHHRRALRPGWRDVALSNSWLGEEWLGKKTPAEKIGMIGAMVNSEWYCQV